jgi:3-hydroxyacyl-[acyl-carrier-protein] dehydratase
VTELTAAQIQDVIPHRYPFLLVDRIVELEADRAVGLKAVTIDEPFFAGHFPGYPVMPGVLVAEALAQVGAVAVLRSSQSAGRIPFLAGLDNFRFRRQVTPGDVLRLEVTISTLRRSAGRGHGVATVDGQLAAEGDITFVMAPRTGLRDNTGGPLGVVSAGY